MISEEIRLRSSTAFLWTFLVGLLPPMMLVVLIAGIMMLVTSGDFSLVAGLEALITFAMVTAMAGAPFTLCAGLLAGLLVRRGARLNYVAALWIALAADLIVMLLLLLIFRGNAVLSVAGFWEATNNSGGFIVLAVAASLISAVGTRWLAGRFPTTRRMLEGNCSPEMST